MEAYHSLTQCAKILGVKYNTLWYHLRMGKLPVRPQVIAGVMAYTDKELKTLQTHFAGDKH